MSSLTSPAGLPYLGLCILTVAMSEAATAAPKCIDYRAVLPHLGSLDSPEGFRHVEFDGSHAFVISGTGSVRILEIQASGTITLGSEIDLDQSPLSLALETSRLYAVGPQGLDVIDVSDPARPEVVTHSSVSGVRLAVQGSIAYVASRTELLTLDVSGPEPSRLLGRLDIPGIQGLAIAGGYAYLLCRDRLCVVDVSQSSRPTLLAILPFEQSGVDIAVQGQHAYIVTASWDLYQEGSLQVVDVSDPEAPRFVRRMNTWGPCSRIRSSGSRVYIISFWCGIDVCGGYRLEVVDIADPSKPHTVAAIYFDHAANDVAATNDRAVVVEGPCPGIEPCPSPAVPAVHVFGISGVDPGPLVGRLPLPDEAWLVALAGNRAYLTYPSGRLEIYDVADPLAPSLIGERQFTTPFRNLEPVGTIAYATTTDRDFVILDVSDPSQPTVLGSMALPGHPVKIRVHDGIASVSTWDAGLILLDVSNPAEPAIVGRLDTPGVSRDHDVRGRYIYMADEEAVRVIDVETPSSPTLVSSIGIPYSGAVQAGSSHLFIDAHGTVFVVDIRTPEHPEIVATMPVVGGIYSAVSLMNTRLYALEFNRITVWNVGDPASPVVLGSTAIGMWGQHLLAQDGIVAVQGTELTEIGSSIQFVRAQCNTITAVTVLGFEAHATSDTIELRWSVSPESDARGFRVLRSRRTDGPFEPLPPGWVQEGPLYIFVDSNVQGGKMYYYRLESLDASGNTAFWGPVAARVPWPEGFHLAQNQPNPFNPSTTIRFTLPEQVPVRLQILDIAGRVVRRLLDTALAPGEHRITWDGRNDEGIQLGSGIYFYRLDAGHFASSRKLAILR